MMQPIPHDIDWTDAENPTADTPFVSAAANEVWLRHDFRSPTPWHPEGMLLACSRWRPDDFEFMLTNPLFVARRMDPPKAWLRVMEETRQFDSGILAMLESMIRDGADVPSHREESNRAVSAFRNLCSVNTARGGEFENRVLAWAKKPLFLYQTKEAVDAIVRHHPEEACRRVIEASEHAYGNGSEGLYRLAVRELEGFGGKVMGRVLAARYMGGLHFKAIGILINESPAGAGEMVRTLLAEGAKGRAQGSSRSSFTAPAYWEEITRHSAPVLGPLMHVLLCGLASAPRLAAAGWLARHERETVAATAGALLVSKGIDDRIGGATLLAAVGDEAAVARLREHHPVESSKQVRGVIAELLAGHGLPVAVEPAKAVDEIADLADFEAKLAAKPKSVKAPAASWLTADALPPLYTKEGVPLSELARTFLFQRQAREAGNIQKEVAQLLPFLDRTRNSAFAHALLDQWLLSDKKAGSRWALDVVGITGDDTIINRLIAPIPEWCQANAGKRAEWVVHAIALLGNDQALRTLDTLVQRYRNHRKYVGAAATDALRTFARVKGVSEDEVAESIVPDFGLDESGERLLQMATGGMVTAVLKPGLKLVWRMEDGNEYAKPPADGTIAAEAKEMAKRLKESIKLQTIRLERAMIEGRRWDTAAWRERFENHPVFRGFAGMLVWAAYDGEGRMLRFFRLYPNGIPADAGGDIEEFEGVETIGLPHPASMDQPSLKAWSTHLKRFKVKPPFQQIERAVEILDPLHGNRREYRKLENVVLDAADFRRRLLEHGWAIGSTQDGGFIHEIFRKFPGLGVEVYLSVKDFHASSGRGSEIKAGTVLFAAYDPSAKRSYLGRMPVETAANVLRFDQVPSVVWSETMADLKVIEGITK